MKKIILFIICFIFGILIILNYFIWKPIEQTSSTKTITVTPKQTTQLLDPKTLIDNPPANSIKGAITVMAGEVKWQSRAATESATITKLQPIQQGELISTGEDGTAEISFNDTITANLSEKSTIEFPQTLPNKFVFIQRSGEVTYTNSDTAGLSVRSRALVSLLTDGSMEISIEEDEPTIIITNKEGSVKIAYNNSDLETQVITLESGEQFIFDTEELTGEIL